LREEEGKMVRFEPLVIKDGLACFSRFRAKHGFSTLRMGNMSYRWGEREEVEANLQNLLRRADLDLESRVHIIPQFGDRVLVVDKRDLGLAIVCDGVFTTTPGTWISLCPADCFQFVFAGIDTPLIGLVHAGWKNTDQKILRKALRLIQEEVGIRPQDLKVAVGPGIRDCCYDARKVALLLALKPKWWPFIRPRRSERGELKLYIDLLGANLRQLIKTGVPAENIVVADHCTFCSKDKGEHLFFSHHRAKRNQEKEGRFLTFVAM
jgi:hypothetical protein